jgi:DNA repair photolyase
MIDLFHGEFLLHPAPLEISGNTCSHSCAYCFSNIRCGERYANVSSFINSLKNAPKENTLSATLLNKGYAICLSNRTDPFSNSNKVITDTWVKYLINLPNGIFFQTKGGEKFCDTINYLSSNGKTNIVSYFTITSRNNDLLKKIEPGAPTYEDRLVQIKYAKKSGCLVIVAFNPICEEWMPRKDFELTISEMMDAGVDHFIFQRLHMNKSDIKTFTNDRMCRFGDELQKATIRKNNPGQTYLQERLLSVYDKTNALAFGMPYRTDFFTEVRKKLGKCFPSNYDFINYCYNKGRGLYNFDDYKKSLMVDDDPVFNTEFKGLSAYILRVARQVWKGNKEAQSVKTLIDVLKIYWDDKRISGSPQNNFLFQRVIDSGTPSVYFDGDIKRECRTTTVSKCLI